MDGTHKGRKRCTGRGERAMWTALFFLLGFDEVAHDSDNGKGYIETINNQTHLPATLSFLPSQQAHIDIPKSLRVEFYIKTRLATRWDTEARGERIMWTALIFPLGFDEVPHDTGRRKGEGRTLRFLTSPITYYSSQETAGKHILQLCFNEFPHGGHLPSLEGTHIDVVPLTRQRWKTFCNRLTGPHLGVKNSNP